MVPDLWHPTPAHHWRRPWLGFRWHEGVLGGPWSDSQHGSWRSSCPTWDCGTQTSNAAPSCGDLSLWPWPEHQRRHQNSPVLRGASDELHVHGCWIFAGTVGFGLPATVFWWLALRGDCTFSTWRFSNLWRDPVLANLCQDGLDPCWWGSTFGKSLASAIRWHQCPSSTWATMLVLAWCQSQRLVQDQMAGPCKSDSSRRSSWWQATSILAITWKPAAAMCSSSCTAWLSTSRWHLGSGHCWSPKISFGVEVPRCDPIFGSQPRQQAQHRGGDVWWRGDGRWWWWPTSAASTSTWSIYSCVPWTSWWVGLGLEPPDW